MCGRYGLGNPEFSETRFQAARLPEFDVPELYQPRFNITPSEEVLTVAFSRHIGQRVLKPMVWSLTAQWALHDTSKPRPTIIKTETIIDRPAYRRLLTGKRCVIPAQHFYEWQRVNTRKKQPWAIALKGDELFGFAGIWEACKVADGWLTTCAILTTHPNGMVGEIHDRMPVILRPADEATWLDPDVTNPTSLMPLFEPLPDEAIEMYPVSMFVNDGRNEGPGLLQRAEFAPIAENRAARPVSDPIQEAANGGQVSGVYRKVPKRQTLPLI